MKLAATICLAVFSLTGCATDESPNGGYLDGLRPAKPSADDLVEFEPNQRVGEALTAVVNPRDNRDNDIDFDNATAETIQSPLPIQTGCLACNREIVVLRDPRNLAQLIVVDEFGSLFCKIWVHEDGSLKSSDCR